MSYTNDFVADDIDNDTIEFRELVESNHPLYIDNDAVDSLLCLAAMAAARPLTTDVIPHEVVLSDYFTVVYFHLQEQGKITRHLLINTKDNNTIPSKSVVSAIAGILGFDGDVSDFSSVEPIIDEMVMVALVQHLDLGAKPISIH